MQFIDERTNLKITGAVDDIWQMRESGKLIIVDSSTYFSNCPPTVMKGCYLNENPLLR